jgi:hypothetical protein
MACGRPCKRILNVFARELSGQIKLTLDSTEREVLTQLFDQMSQLLSELGDQESTDPLEAMLGMNGSTEISDDPALARLFPDGYSDDEHASADFRRFTEQDLRQEKTAALTQIRSALQSNEDTSFVSPLQAQSWLKAINDLRLVLGTRLGVTQENDFDSDSDEPGVNLYNFLTYLQGTLLDALSLGN